MMDHDHARVLDADEPIRLDPSDKRATDVEYVTEKRRVEVEVPVIRCDCGALWYANDSVEEAREHYRNHKENYCDLADGGD